MQTRMNWSWIVMCLAVESVISASLNMPEIGEPHGSAEVADGDGRKENAMMDREKYRDTFLITQQKKGNGAMRKLYHILNAGVSLEDKKIIIDLHNLYRRVIGGNATNMMKMYWDDDVAIAAQKHAESCSYNHDRLNKRWTDSLPGVYIGQNICAGNANWQTCIASWYKEKEKYQYGEGAKTLSWKEIGHYTQLATWHVSRVGCGYAECDGRRDRTSFVCNYAYGQYYNDVIRPFDYGTSCKSCPGNCEKGLCDCGGKICNNFGKLDLNTCKCSCLKFYTGDTCETTLCDVAEHRSCSRHSLKECTDGVNIAAVCPHHCGRC